MSSLTYLRRTVLAAAALSTGLQASAVELRLVGGETSFYCFPSAPGSSDRPSGLACELMAEMAKRTGHTGAIQLYPLARALMVAGTTPGVLVAPVARIAAREKQYQWQVPLLDEDFVVVASKDSTVDISSVEAVRKLSLGVVRDGVGARLAQELGFEHISLVAHDDINARKLGAGRVDAWLSSWNGILQAQRNTGLDPAKLRRGAVLSRTTIYMASAPGLDPALLADWRAALDAMKRDGSYDRLLKKYQYELPK
ncbi:transporter substrate-binding domain-containing protein [Duganella sp. FT80W]|uniref:Transporter substrate-binding domain-containing protein n=1 Tax=Duganella guangzhouensis TaxID=2666084 RepID=A0A6I2L7K3_9BURK|nr:transporter substrate-binding domain-containing protein [Duganella guangzhouensis]MRW94215.1 transporter substrate-binding domain-containing protein [Duganella guangzhouensis]